MGWGFYYAVDPEMNCLKFKQKSDQKGRAQPHSGLAEGYLDMVALDRAMTIFDSRIAFSFAFAKGRLVRDRLEQGPTVGRPGGSRSSGWHIGGGARPWSHAPISAERLGNRTVKNAGRLPCSINLV